MPPPPEAPPQEPPAAPLTKTFVPADLQDREYLKPYLEKPWSPEVGAEIFKKLEGAQALIGKKRGIPEGDDPKEWATFHEKLRPAKADDYELALGEKPDEEFVKNFRAAAFEAGASKHTVKLLTEKLTPFFQARAKAAIDARTASEAEFATFVKEAAGPEWEKKQARVVTALKELVPGSAQKFIDKMDNGSMALLIAGVSAVLAKYAKEDDFNGGQPPVNDSSDKTSLVAELKTLYAKPGWKNFQDPEHAKIKARVEEILASPLLK